MDHDQPDLLDASTLMTILRHRGLYPYLTTDGQPKLHGNPELLTPKLQAVLKIHRQAIIDLLKNERRAENMKPCVYLDQDGRGHTVPTPLLVPKEASYWQFVGETDWRARVDLPHLKSDAADTAKPKRKTEDGPRLF
jgi:hypothetical protein